MNAHYSTFIFFIGFARSNHSLVGQLLNAHPNALISHELNVFKLLLGNPRLSRDELFARIVERVREFGEDMDYTWQGYDYFVPGGSQRTKQDVRVIGDKKGFATALQMSLIPSPTDQNPCAHWRNPMDMMRQG